MKLFHWSRAKGKILPIFCLLLSLGLATGGYAQFSAGVMGGAGYSFLRQTSSPADYILRDVEAVQPLPMAGVYGQFTTGGKRGFVVGLNARYQWQVQTSGLSSIPPGVLSDRQRYNRYEYVVVTPYVGIQLFDRLDIAVGPEVNYLIASRIAVPRDRNPANRITGYNVKATYWLNRLGIEGGYSHQTTPFDQVQSLSGVMFSFYNSYAYLALKYDLIRKSR